MTVSRLRTITRPRSKKARNPFRIELSASCAVPPAVRPRVLRAARRCLASLPATLLRKKLRPSVTYRLSITIVGTAAVHRLNRTYRKKDRPTDVLSFSQLEGPRFPAPMVGEVIVCWPVARRQAKEWENTPLEEMQRLTVHGILHLFGYDHETNEKDARRMFHLQDQILKAL